MIPALNPYPEYKDSGLPWLGMIPSHWNLRRLDRLSVLRRELPREDDQRVTAYLDGRVTLRTNVKGQKIKGVIKEGGWQRIYPGDFAISGMNAHIGGMGISDSLGKCSPIYLVLKPKVGTNAQFISYAVRYLAHVGAIKTLVNTIRFNSADFKREDLKYIQVWLPSNQEQDRIIRLIAFIDRHTIHCIHCKHRLIELLEEQKKAIINRAVTCGLDPNVRLKPSGMEWLGNMPEHWKIVSLRRRWTVTDCKHLTVPFFEEGIPLASVCEAQIFELKLDSCNRTTQEWYEQLIKGGRKPQVGDLIYCRNVSVGAATLVTLDDVFAMGQDVCLVRSTAENQRWLNYYLHSKAMVDQLALILVGSTFNRINVADIKALLVPIPPRFEQDKIANYLDGKLRVIETAVAVCRRQQNLLREYRTRLISDVVTGKLDVRGVTLPAVEEAEVPDKWKGTVEPEADVIEDQEPLEVAQEGGD